MGRLGKFEIKRIEDATSRQVSYSKRRSGIMKKARELAVLCDAQVAVVMLSSTGKHHHFCSDGAEYKGIFDRYQQATGTSLWTEQYENMQRTLSRLKSINRNLRTEIRQRMGEDLDALEFKELRGLEQNVDAALEVVRQRKYHVITRQTEIYKKKVRTFP
uniref:MADS-box transcription factor 16 n=1 Tax=Aegilops tauschii subsp. strangulata TaxID=200361 RepID=A0A453NEF1_AEGTS